MQTPAAGEGTLTLLQLPLCKPTELLLPMRERKAARWADCAQSDSSPRTPASAAMTAGLREASQDTLVQTAVA